MAIGGGTNTVTTLNGNFKEVYSDSLKWLMPKGLRFQNDIEFVAGDKRPGNNYHQPVVLKHEQGFTYSRAGQGAFTINDDIAGIMADATLTGSQMLLQSCMDFEASARASSGGKRAFVQATKYLVEAMVQSSKKRLEIELLYGQSPTGHGIVASVDTNTCVIATAEFAPGLWAGMEGAQGQMSTLSGGVYGYAWRQTGTPATFSTIDIDARSVTWNTIPTSGAPTDMITLNGQLATANTTYATQVWNSMIGIHRILANTGTIFGISASTYSLWRANTVAVGSVNLSFDNIQTLIAKCVGKGGDSDYVLYVNPSTWAALLTDQAALRRHGDPNKSNRYTLGSENIEFYGQTGKISIKASIYMKEGYAFLLSPSTWKRIGATDITFRLPDRGDEFFIELESKAAYALRCYSNQAIFCESPGTQGYLSGIVNS